MKWHWRWCKLSHSLGLFLRLVLSICNKEIESNEEPWDGVLPDDLIVEILSRLPPKPFFRFKCVSKSWLSPFSRASRLNKHLQPTMLGLFYCTHSRSIELGMHQHFGFVNTAGGLNEIDTKLCALPHLDQLDIIDCCNGHILVRGWNKKPYPENWAIMYVYNPAMRKHITIELNHQVSYIDIFSLAFDPVQSQFHVVCFKHWHHTGGCTNILLTFSCNTGRWKQVVNFPCNLNFLYCSRSTFFDAKVHCITTEHQILSVDPINGSYQVTTIEIPNLAMHGAISEIGQSQEHLHFMLMNASHKLWIWVRENDDPQEWIFKHQLNLDGMHLLHVFHVHFSITLHPEKDGIFMHAENRKILSIDLTTGKWNQICVLPLKTLCGLWVYKPCFLA